MDLLREIRELVCHKKKPKKKKRKVNPVQEEFLEAMTFTEDSVSEMDEDLLTRGHWRSRWEFLMSCISLSVGLSNVWRFPNIVYENGGGAFLIPYVVALVVAGYPIYFFELSVGQFSGQGPIRLWRCIPALQGIGYAQMLTCIFLLVFYNYLVSLTVFYTAASLQTQLPWTVCDTSWADTCDKNLTENRSRVSLAEKYWTKHVLRMSSGLGEMTAIDWRMTLCFLAVWLVVFLCASKGIASLGKISYFTTCFPHAILLILLISTLTKSGSADGIKYFFQPQWHKLQDIDVWYKACEQAFFSLGVGFGTIITFSSYNEFGHDLGRDALILVCVDTVVSLVAGCCIFSVLGSLSFKVGVDIDLVVSKRGMGLAFIAYPEGLSEIAYAPQLWSVLFFLMLFALGIGSSNAALETLLTCVKDRYPNLRKTTWLPAAIGCGIGFFLGLPLTTNAGQYVLVLIDHYGLGTGAILYGMLEIISVMWIYGAKNFMTDMSYMTREPVSRFWKIIWVYITPTFAVVIFIYGKIQWSLRSDFGEGIPWWGNAIGWIMTSFVFVQLPLWMVITVFRQKSAPNLIAKIRSAFVPDVSWGPKKKELYIGWLYFKGQKLSPEDNE